MVSAELRTRIGNFLVQLNELYDLVEHVDADGQIYVHENCLAEPLALDDPARNAVLEIMETCWQEAQAYRRIRDWGRAMGGLAVVLAFNQPQETSNHAAFVADVVVRISRWYCADHHWYTPMQRYADPIVGRIWGTLPNLFAQYGHPGSTDRIVYLNGTAYKLKQFGPNNSRVWLPNGGTELFPTEWLRTDQAEIVPLTADSFRSEIPLTELCQIIRFNRRTQRAV